MDAESYAVSAQLTKEQMTLLNNLIWGGSNKMAGQEILDRKNLWRALVLPVEISSGENFDAVPGQ